MKKMIDLIKSQLGKFWDRVPLVVKAILTGFVVSSLGVVTWPLLGTTVPMPWSFILMAGVLWAYLKYFSGHWGPGRSRSSRAAKFRSLVLPRRTWLLSLFAIVLIVLIEQSGLVVTFRLIDFPADKFSQEYGFIESIPPWAGWLAIIMISAVAGICEEIGFRGYMQVPLEKRYSPLISIAIVSVVFVLVHLHQAWSGPIIAHIFVISVLFGSIAYYSGSLIPGIIAHFIMDVFNFSFWWTDLGGQFNKKTLAHTGIDSHFIFWLSVLVLSVISFIIILRKIGLQNQGKRNPG
jgi:membrane protease YdiL (CAAX protease family)